MGKKIAIITPFYFGRGGAETFCEALAEESSKENKTSIITIDNPPDKWQGTPLLKAFILTLKLLREMFRTKACECDIYHAQGFIALLACIVYKAFHPCKRKPIFVTILALYDFRQKLFLPFICGMILRRADKIFVEGETGRKDIHECGIAHEKIIEFYHWVNLDNFSLKIRPIENKLTVLFVGRPIRIKGKHIVQQLERQLFKYEDIHFKYIENVPYDKLVQEYQKADILIVPSQYSEGFPRVVFEAAACGCIVLATDRGSLRELVEPFGHIENFKNEILKFYYDKKWCQSNGVLKESVRTRCYAERFFSPKNAEVFLNAYRLQGN